MSNRYEREIEEILRKTDDARPSVSDRIRAFKQRPTVRTRRPHFSFQSETGLAVGIVLAFLAATLRWIAQANSGIFDLLAAVMAIAAFVLIVATLVSAWLRPRAPGAAWRGTPLQGRGGPRRSPFSNFMTRVNLFKLRISYRQRQH